MRPCCLGFFFLGRDSAVKDIYVYVEAMKQTISCGRNVKTAMGLQKAFPYRMTCFGYVLSPYMDWLVNGSFLALLG